jgi:NAD+ kinase
VGLKFAPGSVVPCPEQAFATRADLIVAIGGDGTLLYAARLVAGDAVPLLGINRGRLGFLTDVSPNSMLEDVDTVLSGRYTEDRRSLLAARLEHRDAAPIRALALNDVVVNKRETGRTMDFETSINGRFVNSHSGDGVVIATATGSTAYAMSCGGPIVEPNLDVWVLAPICPHTLSDRPIVVRAGSTVELRMADRPGSRGQVTCDGTVIGDLEQGDTLFVESADARITLLHPPGYDYYRLLRSKLHWGRGGYGSAE